MASGRAWDSSPGRVNIFTWITWQTSVGCLRSLSQEICFEYTGLQYSTIGIHRVSDLRRKNGWLSWKVSLGHSLVGPNGLKCGWGRWFLQRFDWIGLHTWRSGWLWRLSHGCTTKKEPVLLEHAMRAEKMWISPRYYWFTSRLKMERSVQLCRKLGGEVLVEPGKKGRGCFCVVRDHEGLICALTRTTE